MLNIDAEYLRNLSSKNKPCTILLEEVLEEAKKEAENGGTSSYLYADTYEYGHVDIEYVIKELEKRCFIVNVEYNVGDDDRYHVIRIHW